MRDDKWLFSKLDKIWDTYFSDVPQDNDVKIVWGRRARTRLGSIKQESEKKIIFNSKISKGVKILNQKHPKTIITINSLFKDKKIPEFIVEATIAHELAHYAHGFHSPIEQKFATPHAGGIIHTELENRGLGDLEKKQKAWLKKNWCSYVSEKMPKKITHRRRRVILRWG